MKIHKIITSVIMALCVAFMVPIVILGTILQTIGKLIVAVSYLLWFEPRIFWREVKAIFKDLKYYYR
jgi:hypothetical protein